MTAPGPVRDVQPTPHRLLVVTSVPYLLSVLTEQAEFAPALVDELLLEIRTGNHGSRIALHAVQRQQI
ncbi:MAG TPA: hypothetical protein VMU39_21080 [Solirubrobacteraceae bacterium]|nr:hypothetical protein [Solirubrobacteraceae bacterium]